MDQCRDCDLLLGSSLRRSTALNDLGHPIGGLFSSKAARRARRYIDEHFPQLHNQPRSGCRSATGSECFRGQSAGSAAEKRNDHYQSGAGLRSRRMARTWRSLPLRRPTMLARPIRWSALHIIIHHKSWKHWATQSVAFFLSAVLDHRDVGGASLDDWEPHRFVLFGQS